MDYYIFLRAPNNKEKNMLNIENNVNHKTNKGKYNKHSAPSLFSLVLLLLLICCLSFFCILGEKRKRQYSWIGHGMQSVPTLSFSLWLSEFKTKTSVGFLIKTIRVVFF